MFIFLKKSNQRAILIKPFDTSRITLAFHRLGIKERSVSYCVA